MSVFLCKWDNCQESFQNDQKFFDHVQDSHHIKGTMKKCLWRGCFQTYKGNLQEHVRIHTGERPFFCGHGLCPRRFATKNNARRHRELCYGDKKPKGIQKSPFRKRMDRMKDLIDRLERTVQRERGFTSNQKEFFSDKCLDLAIELEEISGNSGLNPV